MGSDVTAHHVTKGMIRSATVCLDCVLQVAVQVAILVLIQSHFGAPFLKGFRGLERGPCQRPSVH